MDEKMLAALKASIAKWEGYLLATEETLPEIYNELGRESCPLCQLQASRNLDRFFCGDCVVRLAGHNGCAYTPYEDAEDRAEANWLEGFLEEASREVAFLKSLLPESQS